VVIHPSGDYLYAASYDIWHIFRMEDTLPPQIIIEKPGEGEVFTERTIESQARLLTEAGLLKSLLTESSREQNHGIKRSRWLKGLTAST